MNFAKKCKELRIKKAATQEQMAAALKLSPQAISKWENALTLPDITLLPEISVYFGVTIDELFDLTDEKHFDRIQNMVILQETIDEKDFEYAQNFLLSRLSEQENAENCLDLLAALYNHKADEYRRKAEYYAKEGVERFPENHSNHANLNDAQQGTCGDWNLDNRAERLRYYKDLTGKNPGSPETLKWYITELLQVGRCEEAAEAIGQLEALCGGANLRIAVFRARLLWEQGLHAESLARYDELTAAYPDNWLAWSFAGDAFAKACQYEKAIACYEHSLAVHPTPRYTDAPMAIAQICEITGDTGRAIEAWKTYIQVLNEDWNTTEGFYIDQAQRKIRELEKSGQERQRRS